VLGVGLERFLRDRRIGRACASYAGDLSVSTLRRRRFLSMARAALRGYVETVRCAARTMCDVNR